MDESSIDDARERLYARRKEIEQKRIVPSRNVESSVPRMWESAPSAPERVKQPSYSWTRTFFIGSIIFFVIAALSGGALLLFGGRVVSPDRIDLSADGPSVVGGGEELVLSIRVANRNPVALEYGELTVTFPEGTRSPDDPTKELPRVTEDVGAMKPGESRDINIRSIIFAQEGATIHLPISFEYRTEGSNASVVKESSYEFLVSNSPITLQLSGDTTAVSGDEVTVKAVVRGNGKEPIANAGVLFSLPFGFSVTRTDPSSKDGKLFSLGTLKSGEERTISVSGVLLGSEGDKRIIRVSTGIVSDSDLSIKYAENTHAIALISPLLDIAIALNGDRKDQHVFSPGERVNGSVAWENDLDTRVFDGEVRISFLGTGLKDASGVEGGGFYDALTNTLVFTRDTNGELATIEPGEKGTLNFAFTLKDSNELSFVDRPSVQVKGSMTGKVTVNRVVETVSSSYSTRVLVTPALSGTASASYSQGPFANIGPMPPKPGSETLYTVTFTVRGGSSAVADATVSASLPSYVRFVGTKDPASADISVNDLTHELIWNAGELPPGSVRSVSFQIGFTPFSSQVKRSPTLVDGIVVSGFDRFTQEPVRASVGAVTTAISNDPAYNSSWALVSE